MPHGVFFEDLLAAGVPISIQSTEVIGMTAPVPAGSTGFAVGDFVVIRSTSDVADLGLPVDSDLQRQLDGLFAQAVSVPIVLFGIDPGADQAEAATNAAGSASLATGVWKMTQAKAVHQIKPTILIAPGFSEAAVHTALIGAAEKIRAITILDGPNTDDAAALSAAGALSDNEGRATFVDPWVTLGGNVIAPSAHIAAIFAGTNWWESASNKGINGIDGTARPIAHELTDDNDQAQTLNDGKIMTIVQNQGFRTWGNQNLSADGYDLPFASDRRADDRVKDAIAQAHLFLVSKGLTPTFSENLVESVNSFFRQTQALGRIAGAEATLDPTVNTADSLAGGNLFTDYDIGFIPPARNLTFRRRVSNRFLSVATVGG